MESPEDQCEGLRDPGFVNLVVSMYVRHKHLPAPKPPSTQKDLCLALRPLPVLAVDLN